MKKLAKYLNPKAISVAGAFELNPKGLVEGGAAGAHKSPFHGFSVEFAGHRQYMPGDEVKHIDWNVYYKRDLYFIKQYEAETNLICHVYLDVSESMQFGSHDVSKMDYASYLATTMAYLITDANDSIGITLFDEKIVEVIRPSNTMAQVYKLSKILEEVKTTKKTNVSATMSEFTAMLGRRQLVILISDCLTDIEEFRNGMARLRYDKHEIVLFHIMDPYEIDFPMEGRVKFLGLEGYPELKLQPKQIRKAYLKKVDDHIFKLKEMCEKNGAEYVQVNTGKPIQELFFSYLTSRLTHISR